MKWNSSEIPDTTHLPAGNYDCEIEDIVEGQTKDKRKLMYTVTARVREPRDYQGFLVMDWITIGTNDCPMPDLDH